MAKKEIFSPGTKKLRSFGINLPDFPLTSVGSFPKQNDLIELKYKVSTGFQKREDLERKEKLFADYWVKEQERLGFDILVDGEMNRGDMISFFAENLEGFSPGGFVRAYGNRYYRKPIIKAKILRKAPLILDQWREIQRSTHKTVKAILTGPYTLVDWSFNEFYSSRASAVKDATMAIKKEVADLAAAGAKVFQISEPALSARPEDFNLIQDSLKEIFKGIKGYVILYHAHGDLSAVWQKMQRLNVDNFHLETANTGFDILPLLKKFPTKKDLTLGLIDCHSHDVETPAKLAERIKKVRRAVPQNLLWFSPDCGLKTREIEEARKKIAALSKAVAKLRK